ncbi:MAG: DUF2804 family protein [candidate division Zixibacteria bacterium]|nr:DUF2804 family protein [Gammaproteobacteria bacterium]NIX56267.1 DUF2804 family protein [candidate division Zixibacteria bacterium]
MQKEITQPGKLLNPDGSLSTAGWSRQPLLDCNLEDVNFYTFKPLQHFRIKRWDYYAVFTPQMFFSATIADLGYAGNVFVYVVDFETGAYHEEGLVIPLGSGVILPRNSTEGDAHFANKQAQLEFVRSEQERKLSVSWPKFQKGKGIEAEISLFCPPEHDSMTIVIPIGEKRFYYNRKINCLPASGQIRYGNALINLSPDTCLGSLDWGRGVWEYSSFWNWASSSAHLPDGRSIGLNLGMGFGDTSAASENAIILNGRIHKLDQVSFKYDQEDYMKPWLFEDNQGRLNLEFVPFTERVATTNLGIIQSEVHQMFGRYSGSLVLDDGAQLEVSDLIGFAEEHHAKW